MFSQRVFNLVSHLIFSRWTHDYEEYHGSCEDVYAARLGPLHLEVNRCFVLDHDDAFMSIHIPTPLRHAQGWHWGKLHVGYAVCLGEDEIRKPGVYAYWQKRMPETIYGNASLPNRDDDFPF